MKIALSLYILVFPLLLCGQTRTDHEIYSTIINKKFSESGLKKESGKFILIVDRFGKDNMDESIEEECLSIREFPYCYININFYNNEDKFDILKDDDFGSLLSSFRNEIMLPATIIKDSLTVDLPTHLISRKEIDNIFKPKAKKVWEKFYKKYNGALGYFEFSRIAYSKKYAILYYARRVNYLWGEGRLEILIKDNEKWIPFSYYNIWQN